MTAERPAYRELLLPRARSRDRRGLRNGLPTGEAANPACGDRIVIEARLDGQTVRDARFDGEGCLVCLGSASIACELAEGKQTTEFAALRAMVAHALQGEVGPTSPKLVASFGQMGLLPVRFKCALLPFDALLRLGVEVE